MDKSRTAMVYPLDYFSLQLAYALKATAIAAITLDKALMEFTSYWVRVNSASFLSAHHLDWSFDPTTPDWQAFCTRFQAGGKADRIAYDLYTGNNTDSDAGKIYFGCFRFDFIAELQGDTGIIQIHFHNRDDSGQGPLSKSRQAERVGDLKRMFTAIKTHYPQAEVVHGGSWLYNIEAYKRLFPDSFTTNLSIEAVPFPRSSGIWGQFLNSEGRVKRETAAAFLDKVNKAETIDQLLQCFEFKILYARAKIEDFYNHFAIR